MRFDAERLTPGRIETAFLGSSYSVAGMSPVSFHFAFDDLVFTAALDRNGYEPGTSGTLTLTVEAADDAGHSLRGASDAIAFDVEVAANASLGILAGSDRWTATERWELPFSIPRVDSLETPIAPVRIVVRGPGSASQEIVMPIDIRTSSSPSITTSR